MRTVIVLSALLETTWPRRIAGEPVPCSAGGVPSPVVVFFARSCLRRRLRAAAFWRRTSRRSSGVDARRRPRFARAATRRSCGVIGGGGGGRGGGGAAPAASSAGARARRAPRARRAVRLPRAPRRRCPARRWTPPAPCRRPRRRRPPRPRPATRPPPRAPRRRAPPRRRPSPGSSLRSPGQPFAIGSVRGRGRAGGRPSARVRDRAWRCPRRPCSRAHPSPAGSAGRRPRAAGFGCARRARRRRGRAAPSPSSDVVLAQDELGLHGQLVPGEAHGLTGERLGHAGELEHHAAGLDDGHPALGVALAGAHAGLGRLLGDGLVGIDVDPDLAAALDLAGHRDTRGLDLAVRQPAGLERLDAVLAELHRRLAAREPGPPPAVLLAMPDALGRQHQRPPPRGPPPPVPPPPPPPPPRPRPPRPPRPPPGPPGPPGPPPRPPGPPGPPLRPPRPPPRPPSRPPRPPRPSPRSCACCCGASISVRSAPV